MCARGFIFDIEVGWDIIYFNGMFYQLKRDALVEGSTHFKEMHLSFSRESFKVFLTCVNLRVWPNNVNIKISSTHSLAASVFAFVKHTFWKLTWTNKNCLICLPRPPKLPPVIPKCFHCFFYMVFKWNHRPNANNKINRKYVCNS